MNVEQQISRINNMRKQLDLLEAELNELSEHCKQPEFEYPLYMRAIKINLIVKFTRLREGYLVDDERGGRDIGQFLCGFHPHTDTDHWQPIAFDEKLEIADKQLCECWNHESKVRVLAFYDAVNKLTFSSDGTRIGNRWDNYRPIPYAEWPQWAIEAVKTLED